MSLSSRATSGGSFCGRNQNPANVAEIPCLHKTLWDLGDFREVLPSQVSWKITNRGQIATVSLVQFAWHDFPQNPANLGQTSHKFGVQKKPMDLAGFRLFFQCLKIRYLSRTWMEAILPNHLAKGTVQSTKQCLHCCYRQNLAESAATVREAYRGEPSP